jgi:3,4-dihydroxy 2-butanone 4-phosphate synthase/GTP cyclohydrolase II
MSELERQKSNDFDRVEHALDEVRAGRFVIVVDDEERENEGDMVVAAERVTAEHVNFLSKHARGLVCLSTVASRLDELHIGPMSADNTALHGTPFGVAVDFRHGTTTGISAADRAATIQAFTRSETKPEDFARPGHIFPLRAVPGGVLRRAGHTEAAVDLARLAGLYPAGVLCEVLDEDGSMARLPRLREVAARFNMAVISVRDLIAYRRRSEKLVRRASSARLPTRFGEFTIHIYEADYEEAAHAAVVCGTPHLDPAPLVRVHSQCLTGDILGSLRCDCGPQRDQALRQIADYGHGVFLYMSQEGRGIGLANKIRAYHLQDAEGLDTVEANRELGFPPDLRDYGIGAQILVDLGLRRIRILTNNPRKLVGVSAYGLEVIERVPIQVPAHAKNQQYLVTKRDKLGHLLEGL